MEEYEETPDDEDEALEEDNAETAHRPSGFFGRRAAERHPADDEEEAYLDDPDDEDAPADSDDSYTAEKVSLDDLKL